MRSRYPPQSITAATRQNPQSTDSSPTSPYFNPPHFLHVYLRVLGRLECKRRKIKCDRCDLLRFPQVFFRESLILANLHFFYSVDPQNSALWTVRAARGAG
jgi:hypothetical protein